MPCQIEMDFFWLTQTLDGEFLQHLIQVLSMQFIQWHKINLTGTDPRHGRLVERPPPIRKGITVDRHFVVRERRLDFSRDRSTPVNHRAEDIEQHGTKWNLFRNRLGHCL